MWWDVRMFVYNVECLKIFVSYKLDVINLQCCLFLFWSASANRLNFKNESNFKNGLNFKNWFNFQNVSNIKNEPNFKNRLHSKNGLNFKNYLNFENDWILKIGWILKMDWNGIISRSKMIIWYWPINIWVVIAYVSSHVNIHVSSHVNVHVSNHINVFVCSYVMFMTTWLFNLWWM
jgi:hypothetical protein